MLTTQDYLKVEPWTAVINRINELYLTELQPFTTQLVSIETLGGTSTKIVIQPNVSNLDGTTPVIRTEYIYDRLDLSEFFSGSQPKDLTGFRLPTSTFRILDAISELNEIVFTMNDFVHYQYNEFNRVYTLTANPKSLRFVGSIDFQLINTSKAPLVNLGNQVEFPLANQYPLGCDGTKASGQYLTSGFDFTRERDYLINLDNVSVWPSGSKLAAILQNITSYSWVCNNEIADYNIAYETQYGNPNINVIYNGTVLPRYTPRNDIQRVLVLRLGNLTNNVSGYLLIHYN